MISAGASHVCAVTWDGAAKCWGDNLSGKLGVGGSIGNPRSFSTPQQVVGLSSNVAQVSSAKDDSGATLTLPRPAQRIVSLAPHLTELLFAAGAGASVVGVGAFADYPEAAKKLPQVGDSAMLDLERIVALKPDLLVVWRDGNSPQQLAKLATLGIPVYASELGTLADIRIRANTLHGGFAVPPKYEFKAGRQGWTVRNGLDEGNPAGEWDVRYGAKAAELVSPWEFFRTEDAPTLTLDAAFTTTAREGRVYWATLEQGSFAPERMATFPLVGDGAFRTYRIPLSASPAYRGGVIRFRIDPGASGFPGDRARVREIALGR